MPVNGKETTLKFIEQSANEDAPGKRTVAGLLRRSNG
jgi:hypothetical protein